jgi:hypothetical protein
VNRRRRLAPLFVLCLLPVALEVSDARSQRENEGSVSVLVFADEGRRTPVSGAEVSLTTSWMRVDEEGALPLSAVTSDDGACVFEHVPAGRYVLRAAKPGYVTMAFGTNADDRDPTPVVVSPEGRVTGLEIVLPPSATISGHIVDVRGEPERHAAVRLMEFAGEDRRFAVTSALADHGAVVRTDTDETGAYRLYGLPPGTYLLQASAIRQIDGATRPVVARAYYPDSPNASGAATITIGAAQDLAGIDIRLQPSTLVNVSGTITGFSPSGRRRLRVLMFPEGLFSGSDGERRASAVMESGDATFANPIRTGADGRFDVQGVAPGQYEIWARSVPASEFVDSDAEPALWGHAYVSVGSDDIANVNVSLQSGGSVSGRVEFESPPVGASRSRTVVTLVPAEPAGIRSRTLRVPATVGADGSFRMAGVTPGRYTFATSGPDGDLMLVGAAAEGRDSLEFPFELAPGGSISGVVLRAATPAPPISGVLVDQANVPVAGMRIVAFPEDPRLWSGGTRLIRMAKTATDGTFAAADLPPGRYRLSATTDPVDLPPARSTLEEMSRASVPVTLTSRGAGNVVLRVARRAFESTIR